MNKYIRYPKVGDVVYEKGKPKVLGQIKTITFPNYPRPSNSNKDIYNRIKYLTSTVVEVKWIDYNVSSACPTNLIYLEDKVKEQRKALKANVDKLNRIKMILKI